MKLMKSLSSSNRETIATTSLDSMNTLNSTLTLSPPRIADNDTTFTCVAVIRPRIGLSFITEVQM